MNRPVGARAWQTTPSELLASDGSGAARPGEGRARDQLERRYDAAIPPAALDAARYPTRAHQIARARARIAASRAAVAQRMTLWRLELSHARTRAGDNQAFDTAAARARAVHAPHVRYHMRERKRWSDHLAAQLSAQTWRLARVIRASLDVGKS